LLVLAGASVFAILRSGNGDEKEAVEPAVAPYDTAAEREPLRYDEEYPTIGYSTTRPTDPVAMLAARIEAGDAKLTYAEPRGYLDSLLASLEIDQASQVLVFSQTSLQARRISPAAPRAIYFNDDVYVAWVQEGPIEIASMDPKLGAVFYLLEQQPAGKPKFTQEFTRCLSCHDSYSLSGGGVPRMIVGSGYTGAGGDLVTHEGWILVTDRTPLKSRWGGWYVTGQHGDQVHLGNVVIRSFADFERLEALRIGNIETLDGLFDTTPYLTDKSDIVALMVLEHQSNVQNLITRVSYDVQTGLQGDGGGRDLASETRERISVTVEPLVEELLFVDAITLTAPLRGDAAFVEQFAKRAVRDPSGRSLRDLDMTTRMFRYPLSYMIYSSSFEALPEEAKVVAYRRIADVLNGVDRSEPFAHLSDEDRSTIREIVAATKPDLAAVLTQSSSAP
jgi:hypothetical protein